MTSKLYSAREKGPWEMTRVTPLTRMANCALAGREERRTWSGYCPQLQGQHAEFGSCLEGHRLLGNVQLREATVAIKNRWAFQIKSFLRLFPFLWKLGGTLRCRIFFFKILFIHERHRGRDTGRGRSRLHAGSRMRDSIPGLQYHTSGQRQALNHWATRGSPRFIIYTIFCPLHFHLK